MILKQASYNLALKLSGQFLSFLATVLVARFATTSVVGIIAFANSLLIFIQSILNSGFGSTYIYLIKTDIDIKRSNTALLTLTLIFNVIIFISVFILVKCNNNFALSYEKQTSILLFSFGSILFSFLQVPRSYFNSQIKQFRATFPETISNYIYSIGRVIVSIFAPTAILLSFLRPLSFILVAPYSIKQMLKQTSFGKLDINIIRLFFNKFRGYFIITFAQNLPNSFDKLILGTFISDEILGVYSIPSRIQQMVKTIILSLMIVLFPHFTDLIKQKKENQIKNILKDYLEFVIYFCFPLASLGIIFSEQVLTLIFGKEYSDGSIVFIIFIVLSLVDIIGQPFITLNSSYADFKKSNKFNLIYISFVIFFFLTINSVFTLSNLTQINIMALNLLISKVILSILYIKTEIKRNNYQGLFPTKLIILNIGLFILSILLNNILIPQIIIVAFHLGTYLLLSYYTNSIPKKIINFLINKNE